VFSVPVLSRKPGCRAREALWLGAGVGQGCWRWCGVSSEPRAAWGVFIVVSGLVWGVKLETDQNSKA
jgi:hypothetical protein